MNRKIALGTLAAVLVVAVAWYALLWKPTTRNLHTAQATAATAQADLSRLRVQVASLSAQDRRLPQEEHRLASLEVSVPRTVSVTTVIDQMTAVAHSAGVDLSSESQSLPTPAATSSSGSAATPGPVAGLQQLQLNLTATGSYKQVMAFLHGLGRMPRATIIQSVSIAGSTSPLTATIQAVVFYNPAPLPKVPVR